ncbi:hypothetical protein PORY_000458 [Pneumocystis oryctolagi]|uniref:Uncharacterized protein n=1 Tax=Pneumocystis oryctolagi TaxID=42067 RepID=A0ACB7CFY1_9ASCO|nr:hypothetical protein PORY_000458 [Pneumocystis oryctolagi]
MVHLNKFYDTVDLLSERFIERLSEAVSIPSVSSDAVHRHNVIKMAEYLFKEMEKLGISVEKRFLGTQIHFDVQPALISDGWETDPWKLTYNKETCCMYGRGISDDKGPVLGWLSAIEAFQIAGIECPVNIVFCFEGMEENGSIGLDELVEAESQKYFANIDCVCISDNYWLGTKKPCLTYGLRGISCYSVTVTGPTADLHSGVFGGVVHEPMTDLIHLLSSLVNTNGMIQIPGIMDEVEPLLPEERVLYESISVTMEDIYHSAGCKSIIHDEIETVLLHRWRYPSLSIHGIEGAFSSSGIKTVIPSKVIGKFSIRLVPNMDPDNVCYLVKKYLESVFSSLNSKNTLNGAHSINEKLDLPNFINGIKLFGTYLCEVAAS